MRSMVLTAAGLALALGTGGALAEGQASKAQQAGQQAMGGHTVVMPNELKWQPAPPSLPQGAQIAVVEGDPGATSGTFTLRLKAPAGWHVPPHSHPTDEGLTVISGSVLYGMDAKADKSKAMTLPVGAFVYLPAKEPHQVWVGEQGLELQVHGTSPFDVTYLNPADDPRKEQAQTPAPK